jgi:hypothetical protein
MVRLLPTEKTEGKPHEYYDILEADKAESPDILIQRGMVSVVE